MDEAAVARRAALLAHAEASAARLREERDQYRDRVKELETFLAGRGAYIDELELENEKLRSICLELVSELKLRGVSNIRSRVDMPAVPPREALDRRNEWRARAAAAAHQS